MLACGVGQAQQAGAAPLNINQLSGTWYEVAHYGVKRERNCASDTVLLIAPGNNANQLLFVNSCNHRKHYTDEWQNLIFWKKGTQPSANLKVRTLPLLSRPLTVVALQPASWLLLGAAKHKSLQLYSRTPALPESDSAAAKSAASAAGYTGMLVPIPQPGR